MNTNQPCPSTSPVLYPAAPSLPRTQYCHWEWCRMTFVTHDQLVDHVVHDHVRNSKPTRKRDIALMRKLDAESIRSTGQTDSDLSLAGPRSSSQQHSPPRNLSSPDQVAMRAHILPISHSRSSVEPQVQIPSSPILDHSPSEMHSPSSFKNLTQFSSPAGSPSVLPLPQSPDLRGLVDRSLRRKHVTQKINSFDQIHRRSAATQNQTFQKAPLLPSSHSQSSSLSSQEVELQLAQVDDGDVSSAANRTRGLLDVNATPETHPGSLMEGEESVDTDGPNLQWPGSDDENDVMSATSPAARHRSLNNSSPRNLETSLPIPPRPHKTGTSRSRQFRSGSLDISPPGPFTPKLQSYGTTQQASRRSPREDMEVSQEDSQNSNNSVYSYPMVLQTQAPYQSQSSNTTQ
ncbi:hypothetical protein BJ138DRAFT_400246 [Hygrophoropsis aurantiaca]|uniref:Uncharacterized protein n=1 Tax=Hygrophoropsis aurantiaca TaxID=72124 RepID=A0ACB8AMI8_9AGAM|nr:hypothetical protein BJ138DRAFT_400246 [Hygrophoropsis aurantiaca]